VAMNGPTSSRAITTLATAQTYGDDRRVFSKRERVNLRSEPTNATTDNVIRTLRKGVAMSSEWMTRPKAGSTARWWPTAPRLPLRR
jgi:hypothetical protein